MNYLDLCTGMSAATVAWHSLGWKPIAFSEIDPAACALLRHRYPETPNWGDMTKFKEWPDAAVDVLVGGTPCQSFSVAGLRKGLADPRGNLMLTYLAIADRYRPTWLVWENVPGVLSSESGRDFGTFLGALGELGYGWAYRSLDAQYFHLAQRRERVFVVGCLGGWPRAAEVLFERESMQGYPAPRRQARKDVAPTLSARTRGGGGLGTDFDCDGGLVCLESGQANADGGIGLSTTLTCLHEAPIIIHALRADGFDASEDGTGRGTPLVPVFAMQTSHGSQHGLGVSDDGSMYTLESAGPHAVAFNNTGNGWWEKAESAATVRKGDEAGGGGARESTLIAFSSKDHGSDAGDISPTLRSMGHDGSHANGGGQVAVAFQENQRAEVVMSEVAYPLKVGDGKPGQGYSAVAFRTAEDGAAYYEGDASAPLTTNTDSSANVIVEEPYTLAIRGRAVESSLEARQDGTANAILTPTGGRGGIGVGAIHQGWAVRRLTPRECERLQGFPDDYSLVPFRGKPMADGNRYKMLGNSMAVPVMRWIGERIAEVAA